MDRVSTRPLVCDLYRTPIHPTPICPTIAPLAQPMVPWSQFLQWLSLFFFFYYLLRLFLFVSLHRFLCIISSAHFLAQTAHHRHEETIVCINVLNGKMRTHLNYSKRSKGGQGREGEEKGVCLCICVCVCVCVTKQQQSKVTQT